MNKRHIIVGASTLLLAYIPHSFGVVDQAIQIQGTNLVLSWPSQGREIYLVQYRHTLNADDAWIDLTNAYHANSTSRTTFTIPGVVVQSAPTSSSMGTLSARTTANSGSLALNASSAALVPMVMPANGIGGAVPLALYPPGIDLSGFVIFDPATGETVSGNGLTAQTMTSDSGSAPFPSPMGGSGGGSGDILPEPETGFYRVWHIPNLPDTVTNYTFNGPIFIPVDYADYVDRVESTKVLIDGQPSNFAEFMPYVNNGLTNWGFGIYFDRISNGSKTIQLVSSLRQSDTLDDNTKYLVLSNRVQNITVQNAVTFPNWDDLAWDNSGYTFRAQSSVTNVDWEIDVYDYYGNYVNSQTGHSSNGSISWKWDMTDYKGNSRRDADADPNFYPQITIAQSVSGQAVSGGISPNAGGSSTTTAMPPIAAPYPSKGAWLFAYQDNFYKDAGSEYENSLHFYDDGIQLMEGGPWDWSIPAYDNPLKFGTNYTQTERDDSWSEMLYSGIASSVGQIRNFYYYGHGAANLIGADMHTYDTNGTVSGGISMPGSKAFVTSQTVKDKITYNKYNGAHPFRFVFLDGCNTANGDWPEAWGIPKQILSIDYYLSTNNTRNVRPSVFVGWNTTVGGSKEWGTVKGFWDFRSDWMAEWQGRYFETLSDAFLDARDVSNWVTPAQLNSHLCIYGFEDMYSLAAC